MMHYPNPSYWDFANQLPHNFQGHGMEGAGMLPPRYRLPLPILKHKLAPMDATTQPVATSAGSDTSGSTSMPTQFSMAQWQAIQDAIDHVMNSGSLAHGESLTTIWNGIQSYLVNTGLFTSQEISIVLQGAHSADSHSGSFVEQADPQGKHGGDGGAALRSGFLSSIQQTVLGWFSSAPPPTSSSSSGGSTTDPNLSGLIGALTNPISAPQIPPSSPVAYPTQTTSGGGSPFGIALVLGGIGLGFYWYFEHHKHKEGKGAE